MDYDGPKSPHPTSQEPLGVSFPGRTWANVNGDDVNWVGHVVNMISDERRDLLVYDYAVGGDRVENLEYQVGRGFQTIRDRPEWAPWTAADSLFGELKTCIPTPKYKVQRRFTVTWIGINDCAYVVECHIGRPNCSQC